MRFHCTNEFEICALWNAYYITSFTNDPILSSYMGLGVQVKFPYTCMSINFLQVLIFLGISSFCRQY